MSQMCVSSHPSLPTALLSEQGTMLPQASENSVGPVSVHVEPACCDQNYG